MNGLTEADLINLGQEIEAALTAAGIANEVFHDEDGDEGWHLTVGVGHEHYMEQGGGAREFTLAYWTRDDTWYWDRIDADGKRSGPWPCRDLDAAADVPQIVTYVRRNVTCNEAGCAKPPYPGDQNDGRITDPEEAHGEALMADVYHDWPGERWNLDEDAGTGAEHQPPYREAVERYLIEETQAALIRLIRDLTDPDPCTFDHHGHCQAHGWTDTKPPCPHGRAQDLLRDERLNWRPPKEKR